VLEEAAPAQGRVDRVGDEGAIATAEILVVAKELSQLAIGGRVGRQHRREGVDDRIELRAGEVHGNRPSAR
jgi:hypothetical protein